MNTHDVEAIVACFYDDGVLIEPAGEFRGREAIADYWRAQFEAFPDLEGRDELKAATGEAVLNQWLFEGTNTGPIQTPEGSVPATGRRLTLRGCDVVTVRDGLVESEHIYYDQLEFMKQLGLAPEGVPAS